MKPRLSSKTEAGLTLFEVGVVVALVLLLAALLLPMLRVGDGRMRKTNCTINLKQVGLAYRIWEGDNGDIYPMGISVTNGGSMEMVQTGNVVQTFAVMSNELSTTKILICPQDTGRWAAGSGAADPFRYLANSNISYSVAVDTTNEANPQMFLSGDCNFEVAGKPVKSGLVFVWTNDPVTWSVARHVHSGNLGLADGSVQSVTDAGLRNHLIQTGIATNRLAIP